MNVAAIAPRALENDNQTFGVLEIDPLDLSTVSTTLKSIANEMGDVLARAAYSTVVREAMDLATCIADASGRIIAQAELNAIHMNSAATALRHAYSKIDIATIRPNEVILTNNPFEMGQHLNDIIMFYPVFFHGKLVAWSGTICHHLDMGGGIAGANANATEIFHEGIVFPTMKIDAEKDLNGGPFEQILAANLRLPEAVLGDFRAQQAAALRGRTLILGMFERYGAELVERCMEAMLSHAEQIMRATVASIPDGIYRGSDTTDGRNLGDPLLNVRMTVEIKGSEAIVDLSETDDQVNWPINCPLASTEAAVQTIFAMLCEGGLGINDGSYRPITIRTRLGSLVNPKHPAPVRGRMAIAHRVVTSLKRALVEAIPDRLAAASNDSTNFITMSYRSQGRYEMFSESVAGGLGASSEGDGEDVISQTIVNTANTPIECIENDHAFVRVASYGVAMDSGGAGKFRGGLGALRVYEILKDGVLLSTSGDRHGSLPWGIAGGHSAAASVYTILREDQTIRIPAITTMALRAGDKFVVRLAGGGGFGDPMARDRARVLEDLRAGRISRDAAVQIYGLSSEDAPQ